MTPTRDPAAPLRAIPGAAAEPGPAPAGSGHPAGSEAPPAQLPAGPDVQSLMEPVIREIHGLRPRTWTIELPPSTVLLTSNHRLHRMQANAVTQSLGGLAIQLARQQRIPRLERADILVTYLPPPRLRRLRHPLASERVEDPDALAPTGKALIDGLTQAGVFISDSRKHVRRVTYELLPGSCPRGQVLLHITEVMG